MSLEHAVLGFLNYRSFSGYDLKKMFDTSVNHFWRADQSQLYRTLARLNESGLVEQEVIEQEDRPNRKEYQITDAGKHALADWLRSPVGFPVSRSAPLVQVFFAGQLSDDEILETFERAASSVRQGLAQLEQIPQNIEEFSDVVESEREFYCWMLTLEAGIKTAEANLVWMESVIERIKNGEMPKS